MNTESYPERGSRTCCKLTMPIAGRSDKLLRGPIPPNQSGSPLYAGKMTSNVGSAAMFLLLVGCGATAPNDPQGRGVTPVVPSQAETPMPPTTPRPCPQEMVFVAGQFCIDRYEASMVDDATGQPFSPYYPPDYEEMRKAVVGQAWGPAVLRKAAMRPPVPPLPDWQRSPDTRARAVSLPAVTPQGYLSKLTAKAACQAAGKRLCTIEEWNRACRGESDTAFPYGAAYQAGVCNVHGPNHPAAILWGDSGLGHWDPRLNRVSVNGVSLLKATGETTLCKSTWGDDAVYDMVGNLDEWVEGGKKGVFAGGFYARDTTRGCSARVVEHGATFFDYSTGVRCCAEVRQ